MNHKVLITTHGRVGETNSDSTYTNRALARVGKKPLISHIIDSYKKDTNFVVTIGYFGNHVRDFLSLAYPDYHIEYLEIKDDGKSVGSLNSSLFNDYSVHHDVDDPKELEAASLKAGESPEDLPKSGESIFIFDTFVIKFFSDQTLAKNRAERGKILEGFVPKIEGYVGNFYRYKFVEGELYSHIVQPTDFKKFLEWTQNSFWREEREVKKDDFIKACHSFYVDKTNKRINQFLKANNLEDREHVINGEHVPTIKEIFRHVDFDVLSDGLQSRFHGDFILDNILKTDRGYTLIDWRQDFGGLLRGGDRYYDLAKLNHNLTVNHAVINQNLFTMESDGINVRAELMRPSALVDCQVTLFDFIRKYKYDTRKIRQLTAIIWLNMAPLHHYPFDHFLYYFGKLNLWRSLKQNDILRKL